MIILDTCALIFDALSPEKLSVAAKKTITSGEKKNQLFCCDISLWEIAMLIQKKRLSVDIDTESFCDLILQAKQIQVLPINSVIAALSTNHKKIIHFDPADRLIAATTLHYQAKLVTSDKILQRTLGASAVG